MTAPVIEVSSAAPASAITVIAMTDSAKVNPRRDHFRNSEGDRRHDRLREASDNTTIRRAIRPREPLRVSTIFSSIKAKRYPKTKQGRKSHSCKPAKAFAVREARQHEDDSRPHRHDQRMKKARHGPIEAPSSPRRALKSNCVWLVRSTASLRNGLL